MPFTSGEELNLAANAKTTNRLSGNINEFVPFDAEVNIYAVSSAGGINIQLLADSDVLIDDTEIVTIGTTLNKSDHLLDSFNVAAGTRLGLFLREVDGVATVDVLWGVEIIPLD